MDTPAAACRALNIAVVVLACLLGPTLPAHGAGQAGRATASGDGVAWHHELQARVLRDMSRVMSRMAQRMAGGGLAPTEASEMSARMRRMGEMMLLLEQWQRDPRMRGPQTAETLESMRGEMQRMSREMGD